MCAPKYSIVRHQVGLSYRGKLAFALDVCTRLTFNRINRICLHACMEPCLFFLSDMEKWPREFV